MFTTVKRGESRFTYLNSGMETGLDEPGTLDAPLSPIRYNSLFEAGAALSTRNRGAVNGYAAVAVRAFAAGNDSKRVWIFYI
ncbi:hypothetical protein FAZ69_15975 [Trinickia terrae]|uniref:Uncharacterized protein n=1 Tax=Trinickia terrae TaxID=2571161 RepID=A0A4U1I3G7_9BURK|nr:hypothetical protein [Trinickia terrae]TKC87777.1 hypothetical protein FAZ69_15975 [Trinickia terrae]